MSLLDSIIANQGSPRVVSEQHDASKINWVGGLSDPGEMIGCGMYQELRRHAGETDVAYAERLPVELAKIPSLHREQIEAAMKAAAMKRASLATSNGKVNLMVAGKPPWTGLGTHIENACHGLDALALSHTNWTVSKKPLYYLDNTDTKRQSKSAWSIVRDDTGAELGTVGKVYKEFQNSEVVEFLDAVIGEFGAKYESAGALFDGEKVFYCISMPEQSFTINGGDEQKAYAAFLNYHDGSAAARVLPTSLRVECNNTFTRVSKERNAGLWIRHTGDLKRKVEAARVALGLAVEELGDYKEAAEELYKKPMADVTPYFNDVLDAVLDITQAEMKKGPGGLLDTMLAKDAAQRELIQKAFEKQVERRESILEDIITRHDSERCANIRGTAFGAFNAVTEWADHAKHGRQAQDQATRQSRRFESVLLGEMAEAKQTAFEIALKA